MARAQLRWTNASQRATIRGPLAAGKRAVRDGPVGCLADPGTLTQLRSGDPLGPLAGDAVWDVGGLLQINSANVTLANYHLIGTAVTTGGSAATLTISNCYIEVGLATPFYGVYNNDTTNGRTIMRDVTITKVPDSTGAAGISGNSGLWECYRCDVSGFEDAYAGGGNSILDQCYAHALDDLGVGANAPHNDCVQHYPGFGPGYTITNSYLVCGSGTSNDPDCTSAAGESAALTFKTDDACVARNNYLRFGGWNFRIEGATNVTFQNNDFGHLSPGDFGTVLNDAGSIASWSNNRDYLGNLIPQP